MNAKISLLKIDLGQYGEGYKLTFDDMSNPNSAPYMVNISECDFKRLKTLFSHCELSGQFDQNEKYTGSRFQKSPDLSN
jgi:hypothetical protein